MPQLVEQFMAGELMLEEFVSWRYPLEEINKGIQHLVNSEGYGPGKSLINFDNSFMFIQHPNRDQNDGGLISAYNWNGSERK
jgi:hypothetical protein